MAKTAYEAEKTKLGENDIRVPYKGDDREVTEFLAKQAVKSQRRLNVKAIVTDSHTGRTRVMAAFREKSVSRSLLPSDWRASWPCHMVYGLSINRERATATPRRAAGPTLARQSSA